MARDGGQKASQKESGKTQLRTVVTAEICYNFYSNLFLHVLNNHTIP